MASKKENKCEHVEQRYSDMPGCNICATCGEIVVCKPADVIEAIKKMMNQMNAEERLKVSHSCCWHCGDENPSCQCWNDD